MSYLSTHIVSILDGVLVIGINGILAVAARSILTGLKDGILDNKQALEDAKGALGIQTTKLDTKLDAHTEALTQQSIVLATINAQAKPFELRLASVEGRMGKNEDKLARLSESTAILAATMEHVQDRLPPHQ